MSRAPFLNMDIVKIPFEHSNRENIYFEACGLLMKQGNINDSKLALQDIILALQNLSEAANLGYAGAITMINEIRMALGNVKPAFIASEFLKDKQI